MNDIKVIQCHGKHGGFTIVDADQFEELNRHRWRKDKNGYAVRHLRRGGRRARLVTVWMHRLICNTPEGFGTDHKNLCPWDNTARNLRVATDRQNLLNQRKHGLGLRTSRFKGVTRKGPRWTAFANGRHLGHFNTEVDAAIAYNQEARKVYGEFARLNEVDESSSGGKRIKNKPPYRGIFYNKDTNYWSAYVRVPGKSIYV